MLDELFDLRELRLGVGLVRQGAESLPEILRIDGRRLDVVAGVGVDLGDCCRLLVAVEMVGQLEVLLDERVALLRIALGLHSNEVALQARLMSQALRKLAAAIGKSGCAVIFINQLREKVGVFFGNPEITPGGRALKFYSSIRIDLRRIETLKQGDRAIGNRVRARADREDCIR